MLLDMAKALVGRYKVGEDGGLESLTASVRTEIGKRECNRGKRRRVRVWFVPSTGWRSVPDGKDTTLMA